MLSAKIRKQVKEEILNKVGNSDLQIKKFNWNDMTVDFYAPYDRNYHDIKFEGETAEETIDSIIELINLDLEDMINHIGDCQL